LVISLWSLAMKNRDRFVTLTIVRPMTNDQ
jgi:hypothetical protein